MTALTTYGAGTYGSGYYGLAYLPTTPEMVFEIWTPAGWIDATCDVRSVTVGRGRTAYVEAFRAGSCTLELANATGYYSGWSVFGVWAQSSAYRIDVPVRLRTINGGTIAGLFAGTTDAVTDSWPGAGADSLATIAATDGFKLLARHNGLPRTAVGAGELSGARINRLADDAGYAGTRKIDTGTVTLQATTLDGVTLDLMRQVGEAEWGWLFMDTDDALVFRQRDAVQTDPRMVNVQWVFTDVQPVYSPGPGPTTLPLLDEPFENLSAWLPASGTMPTITTGRTGNGAVFSVAGAMLWTIPAASESATVTVGFAFRRSDLSAAATNVVGLYSDTGVTQHVRIDSNTDGSLSAGRGLSNVLGTTAAGVIPANTWVYVEIRATLHDTTGAVTILVNGTAVLSLTNVDTKNAGTKTTFDTVRLTRITAASGTIAFDDFYVTSGASAAFLGDHTSPVTFTPPTIVDSVCYTDLKLGVDDDKVLNVAAVTPPGIATQTAQDAQSVAWFGPRTWTRTDLPFAASADALGLAQLVVLEQAQQARRVDGVSFRASHSDAAWACACGVRINDRIRVLRTYPDGYQLDAELIVQGIRHRIAADGSGHPNAWDVELDTADALLVRDYGQWDGALWDTGLWGV